MIYTRLKGFLVGPRPLYLPSWITLILCTFTAALSLVFCVSVPAVADPGVGAGIAGADTAKNITASGTLKRSQGNLTHGLAALGVVTLID